MGVVLQDVEQQGSWEQWKRATKCKLGVCVVRPLDVSRFFLLLTCPLPPGDWCCRKAPSPSYWSFRKTFALLGGKHRLSLATWVSICSLTPFPFFKNAIFLCMCSILILIQNGLFWIFELLRNLATAQFLLNCDGPLHVKCTKSGGQLPIDGPKWWFSLDGSWTMEEKTWKNLSLAKWGQSISRKMKLLKEWCFPVLPPSQHAQGRFPNLIKNLRWSGETISLLQILAKVHKIKTKPSPIWDFYPSLRTGWGNCSCWSIQGTGNMGVQTNLSHLCVLPIYLKPLLYQESTHLYFSIMRMAESPLWNCLY